jgi:hypothetical protein
MKKYYIPLGDRGVTIVDWDFQSPIHCFNNWGIDLEGYVRVNLYLGGGRKNEKRRIVKMHKMLINGFPDVIHHVDENKLNNLKRNLIEIDAYEHSQLRIGSIYNKG